MSRIEIDNIAEGRLRSMLIRVTEPGGSGGFSRRGWVIVAFVLLLLLLPTLFLPLAPDQALFFVAGQKIIQGGVLYRDIVDLKPPLIYYLYALATFLFGDSAIAIRLLDLPLQGLSCWLIIRLVRRSGGGDLVAVIAAISYLGVYLGQGYGIMALPESYMALLGGGVLYVTLFRRTIAGFIGAGMLIAVLFLLKYTLAIVLPAAILAEWIMFDQAHRVRIAHSLQMISGFLVGPLLLFLVLTISGAMTGFIEVQEFTRSYVATEMVSVSQWLRNITTLIPYHLAIDFSLVLMTGLGVGVVLSLRKSNGYPAAVTRLLGYSVILFVFLTATIIMEGKYHTSHISRYYMVCSVLAAFGLGHLVWWLASGGFAPLRRGYHVFAAALVVVVLVLYSPVAGYGWRTVAIAVKNIGRGLNVRQENSPLLQDKPLEEARQMADYVSPRLQPNDHMIAVSAFAGLVYHTCGYVPDFRLYHSAFVVAPFSPQRWRDQTVGYLMDSAPRFIVAQFTDSFPSITGSNLTAIAALRALPGVDSLLRTKYRLAKRSDWLELYERRR